MLRTNLKFPEDARRVMARKFANQHRIWLTGAGTWPVQIPLGTPSEHEARQQPEVVRHWIDQWQRWTSPGEVVWRERNWRLLGKQRLPDFLQVGSPQHLAQGAGEGVRWDRAQERYRAFVTIWPALKERLPRYFDTLADSHPSDLSRLQAMLAWLAGNPSSGLYPRQIPVAGLNSKWLDTRRGIVADLLAALRGEACTGDFFSVTGLRPLPQLVRLRILDASLRARVGGLGDLTAPVAEIAELPVRPATTFIIENLQTGLALSDLPGAVAIIGLGYAVSELVGRVPWLRDSKCIYWGDIDTHGLAVLSQTRGELPALTSVLMDEQTLHAHAALWVTEDSPHSHEQPTHLTESEGATYAALRANRWGQRIRLEQERIDWGYAWPALLAHGQP